RRPLRPAPPPRPSDGQLSGRPCPAGITPYRDHALPGPRPAGITPYRDHALPGPTGRWTTQPISHRPRSHVPPPRSAPPPVSRSSPRRVHPVPTLMTPSLLPSAPLGRWPVAGGVGGP